MQRKAEDEPQSGEAGEEPKKSKPEAITAEEGKDCEAVPANGVSSNGDEETNGKAADDIPAVSHPLASCNAIAIHTSSFEG